jgi:hypothetical protein
MVVMELQILAAQVAAVVAVQVKPLEVVVAVLVVQVLS